MEEVADAWNIPERFRPVLLPRRASVEPLRACLLLLAACSEDEKARDGKPNSLFTEALKEVWLDGSFAGCYLDFIMEIRRKVSNRNNKQFPGYYVLGEENAGFAHERPFTI